MKKKFEYDASSHTLWLEGEENAREGVHAVRFGERTFYVALKEAAVKQLGLLKEEGVESPEKVRELVQFLTFLRRLAPLLLVDEKGAVVTDTIALKRAWFSALREVDKINAAALENRLCEGGADQYQYLRR
jgi:hypothetical protein